MRKVLSLLGGIVFGALLVGCSVGGVDIPPPTLPSKIPSISLPSLEPRDSVVVTVVGVMPQDSLFYPYVLTAKGAKGKKREFQLRYEILLFTVESDQLSDARPAWTTDAVGKIKKGMKLKIYGKQKEATADGKTKMIFSVDAILLA